MSYSFTVSNTETFTVTHARHIASKVATDLKRLQRFYGKWAPSLTNSKIVDFQLELIAYLVAGYLDSVAYGFRRNGSWIVPTLRYTAYELSQTADVRDDAPGVVHPGEDVSGASFYSFLTANQSWINASAHDQEEFLKLLPISRDFGQAPGLDGYWDQDRIYSAGGRALNRFSLRRH